MTYRVTLIPGDGTGPELVAAACRVLEATGVAFDWDVQEAGAAVVDKYGTPLPEHVLAAVCDTKTPQGIAAVVRMHTETRQGPRLVALDGVQDPGNVGTILRTADAAGFDELLLSEQCADIFSPKVLRATMGSIFRMGVTVTPDCAAPFSRLWVKISRRL